MSWLEENIQKIFLQNEIVLLHYFSPIIIHSYVLKQCSLAIICGRGRRGKYCYRKLSIFCNSIVYFIRSTMAGLGEKLFQNKGSQMVGKGYFYIDYCK